MIMSWQRNSDLDASMFSVPLPSMLINAYAILEVIYGMYILWTLNGWSERHGELGMQFLHEGFSGEPAW
jgi:hypothetical protein